MCGTEHQGCASETWDAFQIEKTGTRMMYEIKTETGSLIPRKQS